ncbi:MAG: beta-ketoacyl-[acyl-carrier-protein] synthase family protein [Deltaproteobacteria bacterium]|jgi:3-oxoacyl-[acyl-carrier-protein] synthase II|nr:beta-ketoacyl-[acyl-carrier-protein] synthase family protein [Deltaproteobacteria bacterium]
MRLKRVVITGMGAVSPFGRGCDALFSALLAGASGIVRVPALEGIAGLGPRVAGLVTGVDTAEVPRKNRRSMSPMSAYAFLAAKEALEMAGLPEAAVTGGRLGAAMGSTIGSPATMEEFFANYFETGGIERIKSMLFFRIMGHSVAANVAQSLGVTGRVLGTTAACSTSCQAVGLGFEAVALGRQEYMLCGGADEYHPLTSATFDIMSAASTKYNDRPSETPRPFDRDRDGVVCAEGAGVLLLESLDSARARGAAVLAEIVGFSSLSDPSSIDNPDPLPVYTCMRQALENARTAAEEVDYVNAHATGTLQGDEAESRAIAMLFGERTPVSGFKGHMGHTMAASGALELAGCIGMLRRGVLIPGRNLDNPAPECGGINHLRSVVHAPVRTVVKNNFALGGINCSLVLRGYDD